MLDEQVIVEPTVIKPPKHIGVQQKRDLIEEKIDDIGSQPFTVAFIKKTNGEIRHMICKRNETSFSNGGVNTVEGKPDLLSVYDLPGEAYKTIWMDGVQSLKTSQVSLEF